MKKNYVAPSLELLEIEIEDAVLDASTVNNLHDIENNQLTDSGLNDW